jgi:hypothetical protein
MIKEAEEAGYNVLLIDSATHEWNGKGGVLEIHSKVTRTTARGNSYTAWDSVTPRHNAFIEAIVQSDIHIIVTMRSKQDFVLADSKDGKKVPQKIGLAPIQRDGFEYELTTVFDVVLDGHYATASKDRTSLFDGRCEKISEQTGKMLLKWLETGSEPEKASPPPATNQQAPSERRASAGDFQLVFDGDEIQCIPTNQVKARCLGFIKGHENKPDIIKAWWDRNRLVLRQFHGVNKPDWLSVKTAVEKIADASRQAKQAEAA